MNQIGKKRLDRPKFLFFFCFFFLFVFLFVCFFVFFVVFFCFCFLLFFFLFFFFVVFFSFVVCLFFLGGVVVFFLEPAIKINPGRVMAPKMAKQISVFKLLKGLLLFI